TDPDAARESLESNIAAMGFCPTLSSDTPEGDRRPDKHPVPVEITWDIPAPEDDDPESAEGDEPEAGSEDDATEQSRTVTTTGEAGTTKVGEERKSDWAPTNLHKRLQPGGSLSFTEPNDYGTEQSRTVTTTGEAGTTKVGEEWKVDWAPTILDTRLEPGGSLSFTELMDYDTSVLDRTGAPLFQWTPVTAVTLAPEATDSADAVAGLVDDAEPTITGQTIRDGMAEAGEQPYQVVALRPEDIDPIREQLEAIPGVTLPEQGDLIRTDSDLSSPAIDGLPNAWLDALRAEAGWSAEIVNPGAEP